MKSSKLNVASSNDWTALMLAAYVGNTEAIHALCEQGGINKVDQHGWTSLLYAAKGGWTEAVQALCLTGLSLITPHQRDSTTSVSLKCGHLHTLIKYWNQGADLDKAQSVNSSTLLSFVNAKNTPKQSTTFSKRKKIIRLFALHFAVISVMKILFFTYLRKMIALPSALLSKLNKMVMPLAIPI